MITNMKIIFLLLVFAVTATGQSEPNCDLTDAKTFGVMYAATTTPREQKKIGKALRRSGGMKQVPADQADLQIDLTEPNWLNVWRNHRDHVGRWSLAGSSASMFLPGSAHTTVVSTRDVTIARTTVIPSRIVTVTSSPEINTASQFLFQLRVRRGVCRERH